ARHRRGTGPEDCIRPLRGCAHRTRTPDRGGRRRHAAAGRRIVRHLAMLRAGANGGHPLMLGATLQGSRCQFRVWAPAAKEVLVELDPLARRLPLVATDGGYHAAEFEGLRAGQLYHFVVDAVRRPDPCSRYQPQGPHGPSMIVDRTAFRWSDQAWSGIELSGLVLYEMHVGTFTGEGTFVAATQRLQHLRDLGVTAIEVMPLAECS